jgi:hypothetical protein
MNTPSQRRLFLFRARLLRAAGLAAITAPLFYGTACTAQVIVEDGEGGSGEGGSGGTTTSSTSTSTITSVTSSVSTGVGGAPTSSSVGPSTSVSTGVGGSPPTQVTCFPMTTNGCPTLMDAPLVYDVCTYETFEWIDEWVSGPWQEGSSCCYEVVTSGTCGGIGRPLMVEAQAVTAAVTRGARDWHDALTFDASNLSEAQRRAIADAWTHDALFEHASVASFARFALELMALGAPPELLAGAHQAALDEVAHAKLCFGVASHFAGEPIGAGRLDAACDLTVRGDLVELAVATFQEGCVGETLAALLAAEQRQRATDPSVQKILSAIAEDEARHAELAWQTVAWAIELGGDAVREAVGRAIHSARDHIPTVANHADGSLAGYGLLPQAEVVELYRRALVDVVLPCAQAMVATQAPARAREGVAASA